MPTDCPPADGSAPKTQKFDGPYYVLRALDRVRDTSARMRRGELGCNPDGCAWDGGCSYPSICRCEA